MVSVKVEKLAVKLELETVGKKEFVKVIWLE